MLLEDVPGGGGGEGTGLVGRGGGVGRVDAGCVEVLTDSVKSARRRHRATKVSIFANV